MKMIGQMPLQRFVIVVAFLLSLGACDTIDSMFGSNSWFAGAKAPPLPGKRVSVLMHQKVLVPDPNLAGTEILLPRPSINNDWPQPGGYANHAMQHILVNDVLKPVWSVSIGDSASNEELLIGSPIVAAGRVFAMDVKTMVSAFDAKTGQGIWQAELTPDEEDDGHIGGGIAYENGRVFVTTGFAQVIALDAGNGAVLWRKNLKSPLRTAPTVRGGRVFVLTVDNKLYVLAANDGKALWNHNSITEMASMLGGGSPAVDGGVVVVPYSSGELVALKVENGRELWVDSLALARRSEEMATLSHIRGRPVIDRGRVFAISNGGVLVSIDLRSGKRIWTKEIGGLESPWVAGNYIFVITNDSEIVALSRQNGRVHWVQMLPRFEDEKNREKPIIWTGPLLASDRLIIAGSNGQMMAVSPYTGKLMGMLEAPDGIGVPPVAAGGSIFFLSNDAELVAYH